ncbi:protein-L-isoaspartate(D-aspartate) O-methyltransferase [Sphingomicrobium astaxanthinifaciens]|uniref:protein-L-isoaspartate(D-aspartate) O-methyltransferase n=1 Tax=Sphingomicrobium astaxanthinifaciens TaxID=1227949 RepID=UPI001FCB6EFE|nr:protein-L-isoaspartate(D-aspartate) O-methyltransferase [Sphingomicrobium astaxanthinifaciens]MCJ7420644.1 protein-L-isoaspartate(D-aspartate) O-methyltransferase [Sphingomicrobium astaxanthinifaciens]
MTSRAEMVERQLRRRGISDPRVLEAMAAIPRERFIADSLASEAYADRPLPIGAGQTISQPYIVAYMLQALELAPDDRLLEVGAGSGYAAAVASRLVASVHAIERVASFIEPARARMAALGIETVRLRASDGSAGWPEAAPFDAILVSAAAARIPPALVAQLGEGGRMIVPVGSPAQHQELVLVRRIGERISQRALCAVRFVPLIEG